MYIGSHVSYNSKEKLTGCVKETLSYGANTFMFYLGAPQNTRRSNIDLEDIKKAYKLMQENKIAKIIVHAPYIINLANNKDKEKHQFMIQFLKEEIERCNKIGVENIILHPGSHVGLGIEIGLSNIIESLKKILKETKKVNICLETMAGKGTELGINLNQIKYIIDNVSSERLMVCLDTCHLHDAGYDLSNFDNVINELEKLNLLSKIACIHINDSKNERLSHKDRHANIGCGKMGFNNLIKIIYNDKLKDVPKILETPYYNGKPPYKIEIEMIKTKKFNNKYFCNSDINQ